MHCLIKKPPGYSPGVMPSVCDNLNDTKSSIYGGHLRCPHSQFWIVRYGIPVISDNRFRVRLYFFLSSFMLILQNRKRRLINVFIPQISRLSHRDFIQNIEIVSTHTFHFSEWTCDIIHHIIDYDNIILICFIFSLILYECH